MPAAPSTASNMATTSAQAGGTVSRQGDGQLLHLVSFMVGPEAFALPILSVQEINRTMQITRVPQSPPFIEGVINLRGKIVPVMDLRRRFGLEQVGDPNDERIIVVEVRSRVIAFIVDHVTEVLRINADIVEPPAAMVRGVDSDCVQGVGKMQDRLLILLDLDGLFSNAEMEQLDDATRSARKLAA